MNCLTASSSWVGRRFLVMKRTEFSRCNTLQRTNGHQGKRRRFTSSLGWIGTAQRSLLTPSWTRPWSVVRRPPRSQISGTYLGVVSDSHLQSASSTAENNRDNGEFHMHEAGCSQHDIGRNFITFTQFSGHRCEGCSAHLRQLQTLRSFRFSVSWSLPALNE